VNYIKQLEFNNRALRRTVVAAMEEITDLRVYLESSKFYDDPTVQTKDVENRILPLRMLLLEALNI
jgi:hypothetical protein